MAQRKKKASKLSKTEPQVNLVAEFGEFADDFLAPRELFAMFINHSGTETYRELGSLIDPDYRRLDADDRTRDEDNDAVKFQCIQHEMFFNLGLALGKRLR